MAMSSSANVLPYSIASEQLVPPADFKADEPNQETRKEKYQEHILSHDLSCAVCKEVPHNPLTGHCGATLCPLCVTSAFNAQPNKCPKCNATGVIRGFFGPNMQAKAQIATLKASCILECGAIDTIQKMIEHQANECPLRMIPCKHCKKEIRANTQEEHTQTCETPCKFCKQMVRVTMRKEHLEQSCMSQCPTCKEMCLSIGLDRHKSQECTMRLVPCQHCNVLVPHRNMPYHIEAMCTMTQVECPRGCGKDYIRKETSTHESQCELVMVTCDICQHQCVRKDMPAHKADPLPHIDYLIKTQRAYIDTLVQRLEATEKANVVLTSQLFETTSTTNGLDIHVAAIRGRQNTMSDEFMNQNHELAVMLPLMLPQTITDGHRTLYLTEVTNNCCDFCPLDQGRKPKIAKTMGRYLAYRAPGSEDTDMCLDCARMKCVKTKAELAAMPTCSQQMVAVAHPPQQMATAAHPPQQMAAAAAYPIQQVVVGKPPRVMVPGFIYKITPFNAKMANKSGVVVQSHHVDIEGMMVRRGPNWHHDNQDGGDVGVIVRRDPANREWVYVNWQKGDLNATYSIDAMGEHHLVYA